MYDKSLVLEMLIQISGAIQTIQRRFRPIHSVEDFTSSDAGMEKLDAICMQLIAIGENLKKIDKLTQESLLALYPEIEWRNIKGIRDVISHHYFELDAEIVFAVCQTRLDSLLAAVHHLISKLET